MGTTTDIFDDTIATELSDDDLEERVLGYAAQIAALTGKFLQYLAEFDRRGAWFGPGMNSCAQWLSWRAGMNRRTAQEHIRVARALEDLPKTREHLLAGELSFSKVRALTRVATPEREPELLNLALASTASQLERFVAAMGPIDGNQNPDGTMKEEEPDEFGNVGPKPIESYGTWRWNEDGSLAMSVKFNPVDAAHVLAGLVRSEYERTRMSGDPDLPVEPEVDDGQAADTVAKRVTGPTMRSPVSSVGICGVVYRRISRPPWSRWPTRCSMRLPSRRSHPVPRSSSTRRPIW